MAPPGTIYEIPARCPISGLEKTVFITASDLRYIMAHAPKQKLFQLIGRVEGELCGCVYETLISPSAVFSGIREFQEGGRCYVRTVAWDFDDKGNMVDAPRRMVFLVFVNPMAHVFDWRWEPAHPVDVELPVDYQTRFGKCIWPKS